MPSKWALQGTARTLLPDTAIGRCHHTILMHHDYVKVSVSGDQAWFNGVLRCGSVWSCPVCAPKISQIRRRELQTGVDLATGRGYGVYLATLTAPHDGSMPLKEWQRRFADAQRRMKSWRPYKRLNFDLGYIGEIRAMEVTHGRNGWHPHTHTITILRSPTDRFDRAITTWRRRLYVLWGKACRKAGLELPRFRSHGKYVGVDIRAGRHAATYVAKWGMAAELVGASAKKGRNGGATPWELLAQAHDGDAAAAVLWQEYARAMKGQRQLFWSRGLRARLGLGEMLTDQQVLEFEPAETRIVCELDSEDWAMVCYAKVKGDLLRMAVERPGEIEEALSRMRVLARDMRLDGSSWRRGIRWDVVRGFWL